MSGHFLKFKRKRVIARLLKVVLSGASVAMLLVGCWLHLYRLALTDIAPTLVYLVSGGVALLVAIAIYFVLHMSDKRLARALDERFDLQEKVQTMIEFRHETGEMSAMQRADAEETLGKIRKRTFGFRGFWMFLLAAVLSAAMLTVGIFTESRRDWGEPEVIVPFAVSEMQIAGIEELIRYVEESAMESPYREEILDALGVLLVDLKAAETEPQMQAALAVALTAITESTYNSSSMTEILDAMWKTEDEHVRALALALHTGRWTEPDWGDFAEKYEAFRLILHPKNAAEATVESQTWLLENFSLKLEGSLGDSGIEKTDALYAMLLCLLNGDGETLAGLMAVTQGAESADDVVGATDAYLAQLSEPFYGVISVQKNNTNVGEYVLKKLSAMFGVPIPEFERPAFMKNGEDKGGAGDDEEDRDEQTPNGGGVGEGAVFGSDDLVLDPLTGEYVEYGTLYATYNALMIERLKDDKYGYTEAQKRAIEKYFALLYGGLKNEEGNE